MRGRRLVVVGLAALFACALIAAGCGDDETTTSTSTSTSAEESSKQTVDAAVKSCSDTAQQLGGVAGTALGGACTSVGTAANQALSTAGDERRRGALQGSELMQERGRPTPVGPGPGCAQAALRRNLRCRVICWSGIGWSRDGGGSDQEEGPPGAADHHHRPRDDHRDRLGVRALGQAPAARDRDLEDDQRAADPGRRHPGVSQHLHRHHDLRQRRCRGRARQSASPAARAACRPDLRSASKRRRQRRRKGALRAQGPAALRRRERGGAEQADRADRRRGRVRLDHRRGGDARPDLGGRVGDRAARACPTWPPSCRRRRARSRS